MGITTLRVVTVIMQGIALVYSIKVYRRLRERSLFLLMAIIIMMFVHFLLSLIFGDGQHVTIFHTAISCLAALFAYRLCKIFKSLRE